MHPTVQRTAAKCGLEFAPTNETSKYLGLGSYVLFFIILWFTWLQTTLYDIRFSVDSVYERTIKLVHFGVMIGFAATTLAWNPLDPTLTTHMMNLKSMCVTLMASRWALGVQYGVTAYYSKRYRKGTTPLIIHSVVMILCGFGYLGVSAPRAGLKRRRHDAYGVHRSSGSASTLTRG